MTKFKKGDRVRRTRDPYNHLPVGMEAVVVSAGLDSVWLEGYRVAFDADKFELVTAPPTLPRYLELEQQASELIHAAGVLKELDTTLSKAVDLYEALPEVEKCRLPYHQAQALARLQATS